MSWAQDFCRWVRSDQTKVSIIKTLLPPTTVRGIRSFLGHAGFYRRFIRDFSKISRPLCRLLEKDAKFDFDESCKAAFEEIKSKLVTAPIMVTPDWNKEFEIVCDVSDYAMGAVLGQMIEKIFKGIYYARKTTRELLYHRKGDTDNGVWLLKIQALHIEVPCYNTHRSCCY